MLKGEGGSTVKKRGSRTIEGESSASRGEGRVVVHPTRKKKKHLKKHRARADKRKKHTGHTAGPPHPNRRPTRWASDDDSRVGGMLKGEGSSTVKKRGSKTIEGESNVGRGEGRVVVCPAGKKIK